MRANTGTEPMMIIEQANLALPNAGYVEASCKSLMPHVRIIRGYLDDDFTICMYKAPPGTGHMAHEPA